MKRTFFLSILFFVLAVQFSWAPIPQTISYQGVLTDTSGKAVPDGVYNLTFKLYNEIIGGTPLWSETQPVTVSKGIFHAILGAVNPLALAFDTQYWLGVTVEGGSELTPRIKLTSAPYSLNTQGGVTPQGWLISGDNIYRLNGNVGIGTTSPGAKLELAGLGSNDGLYLNGNTKVKITTTADSGTDSLWLAGQQARNAALYLLPGADNKFSGLQLSSGPSRTTEAFLVHHGSELRTYLQLLGATHDRFDILNTVGTEIFTVKQNGNVGIGTTNPGEKLHIDDNSAAIGNHHLLRLGKGGQSAIYAGFVADGSTFTEAYIKSGNALPLRFGTDGAANAIYIENNGNVGIGTTSPGYRLDVWGNVRISDSGVYSTTFTQSGGMLTMNSYGDWVTKTGGYISWETYDSGYQERMRITNAGNVGIGTANPGSYKLAVEGKIGAREVVVTLDNWSDFVFEKDYRLMPLSEVEQHIKQNKHLPNIPSEKEVLENGVSLGEMQSKLLQKVEELTLYVIEQNKRIERLEKENEALKNRVAGLE